MSFVSIGGEVYRVVRTNEIVPGIDPIVSRWRWLAERKAAKGNRAAERLLGAHASYHWGVVPSGRKWAVVALHNRLELAS